MSQQAAHSNRLVHETSPYLKQHAHNPVDWYPWGPEALELARRLDRPIFLSIGYSACHWCHVMEHESFEDAEVARILNDHFVSIKVDREERPDLDQIYMTAVQLMTGQGGWPMSMFLTPDLEPFYGGTYFPPDDRYGRPSFKRILLALIDAWRNRRDEVTQSAGQITEHLRGAGPLERTAGDLDASLVGNAVSSLRHSFDPTYGGFGSAPKFPHPLELRLLLRAWKRFGDDDALRMARLTLDRMAMGGMYDHLGGGFHRYSTDERWLVPHFEKMLYDNALLSLAYLDAYQATREPFYQEVVVDTLGYVLREMTSPEGPFYSTQDADSEGDEGKFFVWSAAEIEQVLGKEVAEVFDDVYDVSPEGNWEGHSILNRSKTYAQSARLLHLAEPELRRLLDQARHQLFEVRSRRTWPGRDEKVLTSWNGLMIDAFAQAASVLEKPEYAAAATRAADFILTRMRGPDGRLLRTYSAGTEPKLNAYLEDYAFLINALVSLYEATFSPRWIEAALDLAEVMVDQFWDTAEAGFFYTGRNHEELIARTKDPQDGSIPSGNSMAVTALLRLAALTGRLDLQEKAEATLELFRGLMAKAPMAVGQMLTALDFHLGPVQEFAVVGDPAAPETRRVLRAIYGGFRPNKVVALKNPAAAGDRNGEELLPLLEGKTTSGPVTTYVCRNFTCQAPLAGVEAVEAALAK
ncbi:MAG TPA: thioredoxin domain-containing protein [Gemmataceae bacterium]|nr:thioredoxin domain-containing protein [Gemmataceae bacterium]